MTAPRIRNATGDSFFAWEGDVLIVNILAPTTTLTRALAILIGFCGILMTALVAAIAVKALNARGEEREGKDGV